MVRLISIFFLFLFTLHANISFPSLHQSINNRGVEKNFKYQAVAAAEFGRTYSVSMPFNIPSGIGGYEDNVCIGRTGLNYSSRDWRRFKVYIPAGISYFRLGIRTLPNSIMRVRLKFKGDVNSLFDQTDTVAMTLSNSTAIDQALIYDQKTVELAGSSATNVAIYTLRNTSYFSNKGGWLYVAVANDSFFYHSAYSEGAINTALASADYKITDKTAFYNWLNSSSTKFNSHNDPIDDITSMNEIGYNCSSGYYNKTITMDREGADPVEACTTSGGTWNSTDNRCITPAETSCITALGSWSITKGICTTKAELDCISDPTTSWYVKGQQCLYDDASSEINPTNETTHYEFTNFEANEQGWQTKLKLQNNNATNTLVQTIKVLDDSNNELLSFDASVSANSSWEEVLYKRDGVLYFGPIVDATVENTKKITTANISGHIHIISPHLDDILASEVIKLSALISPPGVVIVKPDTEDDNRCASGQTYEWQSGTCVGTVTGGSSGNSNTYTPPVNNTYRPPVNPAPSNEKKCNTGYTLDWESGTCEPESSDDEKGNDTLSDLLEDPIECKEFETLNEATGICMLDVSAKTRAVATTVANKTIALNGYFIHYASGKYDWLYVSLNTASVNKLEGLKENGELEWSSNLASSFSSIDIIENGTMVKFGSSTSNFIAAVVVADKVVRIDGYFTKYGSGAYDWIYTNGGLVAKLEGLTDDGSINWLFLEVTKSSGSVDAFESIEVNAGQTVTFGANKL